MKRNISLLVLGLLIALSVTPAFAHHKEGHEGGKTDKQNEDSISDDNDDNEHPSGKDRETNDGPEDDTQGNSPSDPDDDSKGPDRSNGGADKPGGPGGVDKEDQDPNNGCGNDDDFEDDNEGHCGGKPKPTPPIVPTPTVTPEPKPTVTPTPIVKPTEISPSPTQTIDISTKIERHKDNSVRDSVDDSVVGTQLPLTGYPSQIFLVIAIVLIVLGILALTRSRL